MLRVLGPLESTMLDHRLRIPDAWDRAPVLDARTSPANTIPTITAVRPVQPEPRFPSSDEYFAADPRLLRYPVRIRLTEFGIR